ncbi:MAG: hypothetical protein RL654_2990 [Pseudomonadota bacterium]|jgi:DNA-binding CsgD family transcriptional regulator
MHHLSPPANPSDLSLRPVLPLLALFDCAGDEPLPRFERQALHLLAEALDCDGAVWGWGRREGGAMQIRHAVVHQRPEGLLSDYAAVAAADPLTAAFIAAPRPVRGGAVGGPLGLYRSAGHADLRDYLAQYDIAQLMLSGLEEGDGDDLVWLTLYRAEAHRPLGAREQLALAEALPFWRQAHRLATRLAQAETGGQSVPPSCLARLATREAEVAQRYAAGESYKVIARAMGVAPDTVRSQLQQVYRKLGVHSKIALARVLGPQTAGGSWKPPAR